MQNRFSTRRRAPTGAAWIVVTAAVCLAAASAFVASADPPPPAASPELPLDRVHGLQVRYTEARLRVAELTLQRAVAANVKFPDAIGERELQRLRNHVTMLRRQVEIARQHPRTAARQASIAAAEAALADVRGDLEAALRANARAAGSISDINIQRLRAKIDLAEIRLELCTNPDYELSLLAELEWNIEQLTDEVIDLRHEMDTGATRDPG